MTDPSLGRRRRRATLASLAAPLLLALAGGVVAAHSDLVTATPANGSTVTPPATTPIVLTFSEPLRTGSKADITGPGNSRVGTATIDPTDNTKLTLTPPAPLPPGGYNVAWISLAMDGDLLRGKLTFTVQAAASPVPSPSQSPPPSGVPSASPSAVGTVAPSASPSPAPAGATGADVLLPVLAAILAIAVLGAILLRSRRATVRR